MQRNDYEPDASYRELKRTLKDCRDYLDRIEETLTKSKQDNDPPK